MHSVFLSLPLLHASGLPWLVRAPTSVNFSYLTVLCLGLYPYQ